VLFDRDVEIARTAILVLELFDGRAHLLHTVDDCVRDGWGTVVVVTLLRLGYVQTIEDLLGFLGVFGLLGKSMVE
jgi:hypothetical protein